MTATKILRFDGFTLEPAGYEHKDLAEKWTAWDGDHAGRVDPRFWLEQADDRDSYLVSDPIGPVLFFKVIIITGSIVPDGHALQWKAAEVHMQFMPAASEPDHARIREALLKGHGWLEVILFSAGVEEIYFDSVSPGLIAFTTKRMGFTQELGRLRKRLTGCATAQG